MTTDYRYEATGRLKSEKLPRAVSEADQEFFARNRKLSPVFPDVGTVLLRRQMHREKIAARILLVLGLIFMVAIPFADHPVFMALGSGFFFLGFVLTCIVAGNRAYERNGRGSAKGLF